ncbi:MAG: LamG domain-containing protein, partial [Verrucomicrobiota bacterium]
GKIDPPVRVHERIAGPLTVIDPRARERISITGEGGDSNSNSAQGILLESGSQILSTSTAATAGSITLVGTSGTGTGNNARGIDMDDNGSGTLIQSVNGNISLTGTGRGTGGSNGQGIKLRDGSLIQSIGTGANAATVTLVGTSNTVTGGSQRGVDFDGGSSNLVTGIVSVDGAVSVTGTRGNSENDIELNRGGKIETTGSATITLIGTTVGGIQLTSTAGAIGSGTATGDISITSDGIEFSGGSIQSAGNLMIAPTNANTEVKLGTGATGAGFEIDDTELSRLANGFSSITIGSETVSSITNAFEFDGTDDYIQANVDGTSLSQFSIEMQLFPIGTSTRGIFEWSQTQGSNVPFVFWRDNGSTMTFYLNGNYRFSMNLPRNQWSHVALTYDGSTYRGYVDGVEQGTFVGGAHSFQANGQNLFFGNAFNGPWSGRVDEARVWNDVRTPTELLANKDTSLTGSEANLLAYFPFEDGAGSTTVADLTNTPGQDGMLVNADANTAWVDVAGQSTPTGLVDIDGAIFQDPLTVHGGQINVTNLDSGSNTTTLIAHNGAISDNGDVVTDVTASGVRFEASGNIGASGNAISVSDGATVAAKSTGGGVFLAGAGDVIVGTVDSISGLTTTDQSIGLSAAANLTVGEAISSGTGNLALDAARQIAMTTGSSLTTTTGNISFNANNTATGTGNFSGIDLNGSTISTTSGMISLVGQGGDTGSDNMGVRLQGGAQVNSTGTGASIGTITITGTGGAGGTNENHGVRLEGASQINTVDGNLMLTGTGGDTTGDANKGVFISGVSQINSTGTGANAGTLTLRGDADSGGGAGLIGFEVNSGAVNSVDGAISIIGNGGNGSGSFNDGVLIFDDVVATGTAPITITGVAGTGTNSNAGVEIVFSGARVQGNNGNVNITGTGNGTGTSDNDGVAINVDASATTIGSGNLTIDGTATSSGTARGVFIQGGGTANASGTGNVTIMGQGTGQNGIEHTSTSGLSTAGGSIQLTSTGGTSISFSNNIATGNGNLTVNSANTIDLQGTSNAGTGNANITANGVIDLTRLTANSLTVTGGAANDSIQLASIPGSGLTVNAGGGTDELTFATAGAVNLDISGLTSVENLTGSANTDTLTGTVNADAFVLSSNDAGTVNGIAFSSFENLAGGAQDDTFTVTKQAELSGSIDGGSDTSGDIFSLNDSNLTTDETYTVSATDVTRNPTYNFSNIETVNVTAGSGNDSVVSNFLTFQQNIDGGAGNNSFTAGGTVYNDTDSPVSDPGMVGAEIVLTNFNPPSVPADPDPAPDPVTPAPLPESPAPSPAPTTPDPIPAPEPDPPVTPEVIVETVNESTDVARVDTTTTPEVDAGGGAPPMDDGGNAVVDNFSDPENADMANPEPGAEDGPAAQGDGPENTTDTGSENANPGGDNGDAQGPGSDRSGDGPMANAGGEGGSSGEGGTGAGAGTNGGGEFLAGDSSGTNQPSPTVTPDPSGGQGAITMEGGPPISSEGQEQVQQSVNPQSEMQLDTALGGEGTADVQTGDGTITMDPSGESTPPAPETQTQLTEQTDSQTQMQLEMEVMGSASVGKETGSVAMDASGQPVPEPTQQRMKTTTNPETAGQLIQTLGGDGTVPLESDEGVVSVDAASPQEPAPQTRQSLESGLSDEAENELKGAWD